MYLLEALILTYQIFCSKTFQDRFRDVRSCGLGHPKLSRLNVTWYCTIPDTLVHVYRIFVGLQCGVVCFLTYSSILFAEYYLSLQFFALM